MIGNFFRILILLGYVSLGLGVASCGDDSSDDDSTSSTEDDDSDETSTFTLTSSAFTGGTLPDELKCTRDGGSGISAPLSWTGSPSTAVEFALMMYHYPDNSNEETDDPSTYWLLWNIPSDTSSLSEGNTEGVGTLGSDKDNVEAAYTAPCSPGDATHEYTIRLYALSTAADLPDSDSVSVQYTEFIAGIDGKVVESADLEFTN
ncbi:YbhB/YbcL family Raf kinase inhibitor-like protein [Pseudobacteriovorax antillogorgiicola]|uniref:Phospholipid-binding protein, PBP family n=1 Tax=Pseudobacteriovorax antillogorgiicola TaxID=1513793 RepID=A0A1Y6BAR7_9BACT|nr:YbhB/YbcL family Raf kinase inhibitor-like protein [Pseudobacteriovorax antillogorgiicola]TCS57486.1 PBP family phospholipid-binding protein [Pseudobacteriovorax antillogorgiicola]SMF00512.1 phospholipid-binding protein, PBP family [Pseudobacteriovorax antillogorgiicola]